MSQIINLNGVAAPQGNRVIPADAIMNYVLDSIMQNMSLAAFVKIFSKEEAESIMVGAFQREYANLSDFFTQIGTNDPSASGKLKIAIEKSFEAFKNEILKAYEEVPHENDAAGN